MRLQSRFWITLAAGTLLLTGCEQTAKKQAKVQPPAPAPTAAPEFVHQPLPFPEHPIYLGLPCSTRGRQSTSWWKESRPATTTAKRNIRLETSKVRAAISATQ